MVPKDPVLLKVFIGDTWCSQDAKTFINTAKVPEKGPIWVPKNFFFNSKLLISLRETVQVETHLGFMSSWKESSSENMLNIPECLKGPAHLNETVPEQCPTVKHYRWNGNKPKIPEILTRVSVKMCREGSSSGNTSKIPELKVPLIKTVLLKGSST